MKSNILIIAAHPDDEVLGVGGIAIKHVKNGDDVYCLILGEGITSRDNNASTENLSKASKEAGKIIGFKKMFFIELPDNKFDSLPLLSITKIIERYVEKIKPTIVYTHHPGDLNIDHQITYKTVMVACRPCNPYCPREIYSFEVLSSTEWQTDRLLSFNPNIFVNIDDELEQKIKALKKYSSELREFPHSRSVEGVEILAEYRGMQSGMLTAEALYLIRRIEGGKTK